MAVTLGTAYVSIKADTTRLLADMSGIKRQISGQVAGFTRMGNAGKKATKKIRGGFVGALKSALSLQRVMNRIAFIATVGLAYGFARALSGAFKSSIKYAIDFEKQMANIYTMLDKSDKKFKEFLSTGVEISAAAFGESSETLTKGLYDILSASVPVIQSLFVLETAAKAGAAGMSDTKTAADAITSVLNAYQLSAGKAADVSDWLFSVVKEGKLTFADLAQNLGKVISSAAIGGLSLEELGASIATMTRQGIKPREAMTALNRLILSFIKPTTQASKVAEKYGMVLNANTLKVLGLTGVIKKLRKASKEELAILGTTVRAFKGLAAGVVDSTGQLEDLEEITYRTGSTQDAYNEIAETTAFKMNRAREQTKLFGKELGEGLLPGLGIAAEYMANLFKSGEQKELEGTLASLNNFIKKIAFMTDDVIASQKQHSIEAIDALETTIGLNAMDIGQLETKHKNYLKLIETGRMTVEQAYGYTNALTEQIAKQKAENEEEKKWLRFHKDRVLAIDAEKKARKKLADATEIVGQREALEELLKVQREWLRTAEANGKGQVKAMKDLMDTYKDYKELLIEVGDAGSEVAAIGTAIALLDKKMREFGETTEETKDIVIEAIITWQEAIKDYAIEIEDVMEAAISSIGGAWTDLWGDIASGQNMMKKNWADYLKSIVDSFISAIGRMTVELLAFMALKAIAGLFGSPSAFFPTPTGAPIGFFPTPTGTLGGGGSSPVINNSVNASFSRRDMGFIVNEGSRYNNNTRL